MQRLLVLIRHGQSEWNDKNLFTGWRDPDLTAKGIEEAKYAGKLLKNKQVVFHKAFTSKLIRAQHTLRLVLEELSQNYIDVYNNQALNERDYGDLSGLDKNVACKIWGDERVKLWRRSYDIPPPKGESLKETIARVLVYYCNEILPNVLLGKNSLVVAHGNSLRALTMVLDKLTPELVIKSEFKNAVPVVYNLGKDSTVISKEILK